MRITWLVRFVVLALALFASPAWAKPPRAAPSAAATAVPAPATSAEEPPAKPEFNWRPGPLPVELGHDLTLDLPASYVLLGMPDAGKLLEKNGSFHNENLLAVVTSEDGSGDWYAVIRFEDAGYVKDDEKIDADELMKSFREGQVEANKEREQHGFPPLTIDRWSELPRYERSVHHLVWSIDVSSPQHTSVNFNTRVLGRRGFVSINLITEPSKLDSYRGNAATLLAGTKFKAGSRYEDFNEKTDKVAEYGLIGLILGGAGLGAAKLVKVGLLAKFGKVLLGLLVAGKKLVVLAVAAVAAFFKKLFGKKDSTTA